MNLHSFTRHKSSFASAVIASAITYGGLFVPGADAAMYSAYASTPALTSVAPAANGGIWVQGLDGGTTALGDAPVFDSVAASGTIVGRPQGDGYWIVTPDGTISARGAAPDLCGGSFQACGKPAHSVDIVDAASTPDGRGIVAVGRDGEVWTAGFATNYGDARKGLGDELATGIAMTPDGGYYIVGSKGGVFAIGPGTPFHGSLGGKNKRQITGIAVCTTKDADGNAHADGYWLVDETGGISAFNAPFHGSSGGNGHDVTGIAATLDGQHYMWVDAKGNVTRPA